MLLGAAMAIAGGASSQDTTNPAQQTSTAVLPPFVPPHYLPALEAFGLPLTNPRLGESDDSERYIYSSNDGRVALQVGRFRCHDVECKAEYENSLKRIAEQGRKPTTWKADLSRKILKLLGMEGYLDPPKFLHISETEYQLEERGGPTRYLTLKSRMPDGMVVWLYTLHPKAGVAADPDFSLVKSAINRERYEAALAMGNVEMGHWGPQIHDHARDLMRQGRTAEALVVLRNLLATSPFLYQAHVDFMENTSDIVAARHSANVVLANSEDSALRARAGRFLTKEFAEPDAPLLSNQESGLKLVLVPLEPCDISLLQEAAAIYEKITRVPVKIMRLHEPWRFGAFDRVPDQRLVQQAIARHRGETPDFAGWTRNRYEAELLDIADKSNPLAQFHTTRYAEKFAERPGQYLVLPYLVTFAKLIAGHRSEDARTMYVGVTEADIAGEETNFVFSAFDPSLRPGVSILSYNRMMTKSTGEPFESRKRLTERIAKELVPASFKILNLPRAGDPTDPYSYSDGVARLDQKSLTLSDPVREALDKFR